MNIYCLPNETMLYIFKHLDFQSLGLATQVCYSWESILKVDLIWRNVYANFLLVELQPNLTWKSQAVILNNWMQGKAKIIEVPGGDDFEDYPFTLIGDEPFEIKPLENGNFGVFPCRYIEDMTPPPCPSIEIASPEPSTVLKLDELSTDKLIKHNIFKTNWVGLDCNGMVLCYEIITGQGVKFIDADNTDYIDSGGVICSEQEIIAWHDLKIRVWNRHSGKIEHRMEHPLANEPIHFSNCTDNHIVYSVENSSKIYACHKCQMLTKIIYDGDDSFSEYAQMYASGPYFVILESSGELKIFKDAENDIKLDSTIDLWLSNLFPSEVIIEIFHNWLVVSINSEFKVVNLKDGKIISEIKHNAGKCPRFYITFNRLCLKAKKMPRFIGDAERSYYFIYDFENIKDWSILDSISQYFSDLFQIFFPPK